MASGASQSPPAESRQPEDRRPSETVGARRMPLRGLLGWLFGATFFLLAFVQRVSPSVMVEDLMRDFAVSAIILGNLSACYYYAYAAMQIPIGLMMDRVGPRLLLTAFGLICVGGNLIFALADDVSLAYVGRILIGIGAAAAWVGTLTLATRWLPARNFVLLTGIGQVFGMGGAVFGQYPLSLAVDAYGWRATLVGVAVVAGILSVLFWLIVRDHPPGSAPARVTGSSQPPPMRRLLGGVLRSSQAWLAAGVGLAYTGTMLAFAGLWAVPFLSTAYGFSRAEAAGQASLLFIGWAIAAPFIGWMADRTGWWRPILVAGGMIGAGALGWLLYLPVAGPVHLAALILISGAAGATMILTFSCARAANPPEATPAVFGFVNTAVTASAGMLQPLIGWILDLQWDGRTAAGVPVYEPDHYILALSVLPAITLAGALASCFLKGPRQD